MSRGKRYSSEPKLNIKKVIAVIIAILVIAMFVIAIKNLISSDSSSSKLVSTTYFLINKNNRWGVIDNNAKIVIEPTYTEAIIIPNNKKDIFICTYDTSDDGTYKTKVINSKNKTIFTGYDNIYAIENYDENHNLCYEDGALKVEKNKKYGLIDFSGKEILACNYDDIYALQGTPNSIIIVKDNKKGVVNTSGKVLAESEYDEITSLGKDTKMYIVKKEEKYGIAGVLECKYTYILPLNSKDIYCVKEEDNYKVINKNEEIVFEEKFDEIKAVKDNVMIYNYEGNDYAYDLSSNQKLDKSYKELVYTTNKILIAKEGTNYGLISIEGEEKVKAEYKTINFYDDVEVYELEKQGESVNEILDRNLNKIIDGIVNSTNKDKGYIEVWTEDGYKYYDLTGGEKKISEAFSQNNLFLDKKDNKYGYIDKEGNVIVDYIYDDARRQNDYGYCAVKQNGLWGVLNKNGEIICETKYNLDNNLLVDFIGEYHLGVDLNSMYYTNK